MIELLAAPAFSSVNLCRRGFGNCLDMLRSGTCNSDNAGGMIASLLLLLRFCDAADHYLQRSLL